MEKKQNIEALLAEEYAVRIKPQGFSMYPLFVPGRDEAVIEPADGRKLRRGDVAFYRRTAGILVLHRIWKCRPEGFYMVGDNQKETEGPIGRAQIKGILTGVVRDGHFFSASHPLYRFLSLFWLWLRPLRPLLSRMVSRLKRYKKMF